MNNRIFLVIPLIGILVLGTMPAANASKLSASVEEDHVTLTIFACIYQNATSLPSRSFKLNRTAMADVETRVSVIAVGKAFNATFRRHVAAAFARNLYIEFVMEGYWFNVTVSSDIYGVIETEDDRPRIDVSWKAVDISDNMSINMPGRRLAAVDVNFAGRLFEIALRLLIAAGDLIGDVTFYAGDEQITEEEALELVQDLRLFDLRALEKPLEEWERDYDSAKDRTRFSYDGGSTLDLTIRVSDPPQILEGNAIRVYIDPSGEIETRGRAKATGDTITYLITPWYMTITGIASISLAVIVVAGGAAYLINRRKAMRKAI